MPASLVATLSCGLRDNSRVQMNQRKEKMSLDIFLLSSILDALNMLVWMQTKDAIDGYNKPKSIVSILFDDGIKSEISLFETPDDFEKRRNQLIGGDSNAN